MSVENFVPVPHEMWKAEFARYDERLAKLEIVTPFVRENIRTQSYRLDFKPTPICSVQSRSLYLSGFTAASCNELINSIQKLWMFGHLLASALCIRLLFELWARQIYLRNKILTKARLDQTNAQEADGQLQKLMLGSNSKIDIPSFVDAEDPIPVRKFNSAAKEVAEGYEKDYAFLCDFSHPTFLHTHCRTIMWNSEWDNEGRRSTSHEILERVVQCAEQATQATRELIDNTFRECVPAIEAERVAKKQSV